MIGLDRTVRYHTIVPLGSPIRAVQELLTIGVYELEGELSEVAEKFQQRAELAKKFYAEHCVTAYYGNGNRLIKKKVKFDTLCFRVLLNREDGGGYIALEGSRDADADELRMLDAAHQEASNREYAHYLELKKKYEPEAVK